MCYTHRWISRGSYRLISDRTCGKIAPVGKLVKPSDLESEDCVGSTPTRCTIVGPLKVDMGSLNGQKGRSTGRLQRILE